MDASEYKQVCLGLDLPYDANFDVPLVSGQKKAIRQNLKGLNA